MPKSQPEVIITLKTSMTEEVAVKNVTYIGQSIHPVAFIRAVAQGYSPGL